MGSYEAPKKGITTTEFWLVIATFAAHVASWTSWFDPTERQQDQLETLTMAVVAYVFARGAEKVMRAKKPAITVPLDQLTKG